MSSTTSTDSPTRGQSWYARPVGMAALGVAAWIPILVAIALVSWAPALVGAALLCWLVLDMRRHLDGGRA